MTTLQEALDKCERVAIESGSWEAYKACGDAFAELRAALAQHEADKPFQPDWVNYRQGVEDGKAEALAQQGEQQPVAWYEYNQDLDAWFLAYGHNPKAKTRPLVFGDTAAPAPVAQQGEQQVCAGCGIPVGDVHMSTCKSGKWPSRVSNGDTAAPAPQAQPATSDEWLANCPQEVRDFANKLKAAPQPAQISVNLR